MKINVKKLRTLVREALVEPEPGSSDDSNAPMGLYAWPHDRKDKVFPDEPDTKIEKELLGAINHHFNGNAKMTDGECDALQGMLKRGLYPDVLREPDVSRVYRGISATRDFLFNKCGILTPSSHGVANCSFDLSPPRGSSSSWTTSKLFAAKYASNAAEYAWRVGNESVIAIVLAADVIKNKHRFLSGHDGLYKLLVPSTFETENEVVGLGPITVSQLCWSDTSINDDDSLLAVEARSRRRRSSSGLESRLGRCYELSGGFVSGDTSGTATLVHGSIQGFDNPRINHAWVELSDGQVYDAVLQKKFPKMIHDALFNPEIHHRYDHEQVLIMMLRFKHWGPWE